MTYSTDPPRAIVSDLADALAFRRATAYPALAALHEGRADALVPDVHASLYRATAGLAPDASKTPHGDLLAATLGTTEHAQLAALCKNDDIAAALGAAHLTRSLAARMIEREKEQPGQDRDARDGLAGQQASRDARAAAQQGKDILHAAGLGGDKAGIGSGEHTPQEIRDACLLADALANSPDLKAMSMLAGRMDRFARARTSKFALDAPPDVHDVRAAGFDGLASLLPSEMAHLAHPALRAHAVARLVEGRALAYRYRGRSPEGRGPIVMCIDLSGSMLYGSGGASYGGARSRHV